MIYKKFIYLKLNKMESHFFIKPAKKRPLSDLRLREDDQKYLIYPKEIAFPYIQQSKNMDIDDSYLNDSSKRLVKGFAKLGESFKQEDTKRLFNEKVLKVKKQYMNQSYNIESGLYIDDCCNK